MRVLRGEFTVVAMTHGGGIAATDNVTTTAPPPRLGSAAPSATRSSRSILIKIRGALPTLRPAERRVAEAVLADPARVSESSITSVARRCRTSETTVLRFCRALGLAGYPDLRIALARAAQGEEDDRIAGVALNGQIGATDPLHALVAKIIHADQRAVTDTAAALDLVALESAIDALSGAVRVVIAGSGASALVGHDLHHKLHRIGLVSFVWYDAHLSLSSAAVLTPRDVAIGISHTGTTIDTVDTLALARQRGARTIAITNFDPSPLSGEADIVLLTAARETTFRAGAMSSRIAQLAVVDCLFAGVAQRSYDVALATLETTAAAVSSRHIARRRASTR